MTLIVKDWDTVFEDRVSRTIQSVRYARLPLERESEVFMEMMQTARGREAYGVFCSILRVAARCEKRGILQDDRGEITVERLSARTHIPVKALKNAIEFLTSKAVGWLVEADLSSNNHTTRAAPSCTVVAPERSSELHHNRRGRAFTAQPASGNERMNERSSSRPTPPPKPGDRADTPPPGSAAAAIAECLKAEGVGSPELENLARSGISLSFAQSAVRDWRATGKGIGVLVLNLRAEAEKCRGIELQSRQLHEFKARSPAERHAACDRFRQAMGPTWSHISDDRVVITSKFRAFLADESAQANQPMPLKLNREGAA